MQKPQAASATTTEVEEKRATLKDNEPPTVVDLNILLYGEALEGLEERMTSAETDNGFVGWFVVLIVPIALMLLPFLVTHWLPALVLFFPWMMVLLCSLCCLIPIVTCTCTCSRSLSRFYRWLDHIDHETLKGEGCWNHLMEIGRTTTAVAYFWLLRALLGFLLLLIFQVMTNYAIMTWNDNLYVTEAWRYAAIVKDEFNLRSAMCFTLQSVRGAAEGASALFYVI